MPFSLKKLVKGVVADINPWDNGASHGNMTPAPQPASTAQPQRNVASRVFDQLNPLDNGRTFKQAAPQNNQSLWQQGSGFVNENIVKPVVINPLKTAWQGGQALGYTIGGNEQKAQDAWQKAQQAYHQSLPGGITDAANVLYNNATMPIQNYEINNNANKLKQHFIANGISPQDAEAAANNYKGQALDQLLNSSGHTVNESAVTGGLRAAANVGQNALNLATLGKAGGNLTAPTIGTVGKNIVQGGNYMGLSGALGSAEQGKFSPGDLATAYGQNFGKGAAVTGITALPQIVGSARKITTGLVNNRTPLDSGGFIKNPLAKKPDVKQPTYGINNNEAAILDDYAKLQLQGGNSSLGNKYVNQVTKDARAIAANEGLDITSGSPADRFGRIADYQEARANAQAGIPPPVAPTTGLVQKAKDAFNNRTKLNEGGYVKNPFGKDVADGLSKEQAGFINDYANMIKDMGEGNGVDISSEGRRISNNYRTAETKGKAMTQEDWFNEARRQIEGGTAGYGASAEYKQLPIIGPDLGKKSLTPYDTPEIIKMREAQSKITPTVNDNSPQRQALRTSVEKTLDRQGGHANPANTPVKINKDKRVDIVLGPPASGKTGVVDPLIKKHGSRLIDSDEAKTLLGDVNNAGALHQESDLVVEKILKRASDAGENLVMPLVGKNPERIKAVYDKLHAKGYEIHLHYNHLDPELTAQRAVTRFQETGRFVDPDYVYNEVGLKPKKTYDILKGDERTQSYHAYDNNVPFGQERKLTERWVRAESDQAGRPQGRLNPSSTQLDQPPIVGPNISGQKATKTQPKPIVGEQLPVVPSESSSAPVIPQAASDVASVLQGQGVKERGFAKTVRESSKTPQMDAIDNNTYVVKSDKQRIAAARDYIKQDPARAEQLALNPQSDMHVTIGNQLLDHYISTGQLDKFRKLNSGMAVSGTELGRAIHSFADYNKTTPSGAVKFAEKTIAQYNKANPKKSLTLSNEQVKGLVDKAREVQAMPEGRERNIATQQLMTQVNDLIPSTIADKAITVWKAGLLTSPRTTMRNVIGNTLHGITETIKDVPAALNDVLLKQKTGERSLTATTRGIISGAKTGVGSAKDMMKFGFDPTHAIDKYDVRHVTWDKTPVQQALKKYTSFVFNAMGAQDQPFYHSAFARSLYDQAGAAAKNAGKSGDRAFIEGLVKKPTDQMTINATKDASVATFKDKNTLKNVAGKFKQELGKTESGKIISEVVAPFTGVPSSIAGQMLAYSPVGLAKGIVKDAKVLGGKVKASDLAALQRKASQEIGRGAVGTGLLGIGAYLTAQGLMTGNPKDATEARQWQLEGKQANSVMIGGKWRSINSIGPEALVTLAGSKIQAGTASGEGPGKIAGNLGKDFTQQTFLQGVQGPLNAIADPARYGGTYTQQQGASVVPNFVKDLAKAFDPLQRKQNSVTDAIKAGIPGARNTLLPKRDALGNPLKQEPSGANAFIDLFNSKTPIKNDVVDELSRLYSVDQSATPSKLSKNQTILGQQVQLTPQQLDKLEADTGAPIRQEFSQLMATPEYKNASDEVKKKALDSIVSNVRESAKLNSAQSLLTPEQTGSDSFKKAEMKVGGSSLSKSSSNAQLTLAKDSFDKSGKSYQVVGTTVLRRSPDGTITATPKTKFDYQVGTATLTKQKNADDLEGWITTANKQLDSISTQLKDPSIDPLEAIQLQNDATALQNNIDKYSGYGGFTKPKAAKKGKGAKSTINAKGFSAPKSTNGVASTTALRSLVKGVKFKRGKVHA